MIIGIDASHANKTQRTGVEEYCFQIIQEFKKITPANVRVILYSQNELLSDLAVLPDNWEVKILRWPFKKLWSQFCLAYELWKNSPDVYFSPGQLLPFLAPKNSVVTVHDSAFEAYPTAYRFLGRQYLKLMNRLIMKKAKIILTSTEFNKQEMLKYYGGLFKTDKILLDKIKVVPLAYDNKKFNLEMPAQPNKFGKYILSIGRLEEKKNTKRIVEAFGLLKPIFADLKLVLVGHPGAGYGAVCEAVNNSKYKDDIIELGYADDVAGVLKNAQVFVFPSLYEGFGIPVLEAMAVGVPVVTSSIPALLEVAGEAVQYANPLNIQAIADKINKFLKDKQFRQEKIECGLKQVEKYSWQNTAETSMKNLLL